MLWIRTIQRCRNSKSEASPDLKKKLNTTVKMENYCLLYEKDGRKEINCSNSFLTSVVHEHKENLYSTETFTLSQSSISFIVIIVQHARASCSFKLPPLLIFIQGCIFESLLKHTGQWRNLSLGWCWVQDELDITDCSGFKHSQQWCPLCPSVRLRHVITEL